MADLYDDLKARGFTVSADGDKIKISPASKLTAADRQAIIAGKPQLLSKLNQPSAFQKIYQSVQPKAVAGIETLEKASNPLLPLLNPKAYNEAAPIRHEVAETIVGRTPTESAINAASALGGPVAKGLGVTGSLAAPLVRTALTSGAGAVGSYLDKKSPQQGALSGGIQQLTGELGAPIVNFAGKMSEKALNTDMTQKMGSWISDHLPAIGKLKTSLDFSNAFRSKAGQERAGVVLKAAENRARQIAGNTLIPMPSLHSNITTAGGPYSVSFDDAVKAIRSLDDRSSWSMADDSAARLLAKQNRAMAHAARQDLVSGLNQIQPGAGDEYGKARGEYSAYLALRHMFGSDKDLFPRKGGVDWAKAKELVENGGNQGFRDDLERAFGLDGTNQLLKILGRGELTTEGDIEGQGLGGILGNSIRAFIHPGGAPSMYAHLPVGKQLSGKLIGQVPRRLPAVGPAPIGIAAGQKVNDLIQQLLGAQP